MSINNRLINAGAAAVPGPIGVSYVGLFNPNPYLDGIGATATQIWYSDNANARVGRANHATWTSIGNEYFLSNLPYGNRSGLAVDNSYVWVTASTVPEGGSNNGVFRANIGSATPNVTITPPFFPHDVTILDDGIAVSSRTSNTIAIYNSSNVLVNTFTVPQQSGAMGIAWDGYGIWVGGQTDNIIYKYSKSGSYLGVSIDWSTPSWYLTFGGDYFYVKQTSSSRNHLKFNAIY